MTAVSSNGVGLVDMDNVGKGGVETDALCTCCPCGS